MANASQQMLVNKNSSYRAANMLHIARETNMTADIPTVYTHLAENRNFVVIASALASQPNDRNN
eukprot:3295625-Alexandrium_andersonii.AAC.1